ncbi:MAG TPA: magnesium transporter CorA family protein [Candidatus Dormibacteraeota bacterium]|nr:magnesium transporter CorA family protein [Candidatus Dormibacteraeota bacterium]
MRTLVTKAGERSEVSLDDVRERLRSGHTGFWLDIEQPGADDYRLLLDDLGFHPLTVEDVQLQNQRPKLDLFPGYKFAVLFTAELDGDELAFREYHLYLSHRWLITIHHQRSPALDGVRERIAETPDLTRGELGFLQYLVIAAIVESLFPTLDQLDEAIDAVEDRALVHAPPDTLARISDLKQQVSELRRIVSPQREVFQRLLAHSLDHAGEELTLYWRDVYEQLVRQYEMVDSLRDLLTGTMDVYMSTVSNRLSATMKQLTVIASVFLPLTFFTGFFGMNFGYLVNHISSDTAFLLGMALMALAVGAQVYVFRRQGWI